MPRRAPERFDEWLDFGHDLIAQARDERELRLIEGWAEIIRIEARLERRARSLGPHLVERNLRPAEAAARLGISVRKLTRERFTTYREICVPIEGQTRGYVVSETALAAFLLRQQKSRA